MTSFKPILLSWGDAETNPDRKGQGSKSTKREQLTSALNKVQRFHSGQSVLLSAVKNVGGNHKEFQKVIACLGYRVSDMDIQLAGQYPCTSHCVGSPTRDWNISIIQAEWTITKIDLACRLACYSGCLTRIQRRHGQRPVMKTAFYFVLSSMIFYREFRGNPQAF